ncbi:amidase signature domain-containing protein [Apiosordaria backusii]|uniref:Amidase signature domain-containing protein n=1 Tax=Apiosordaria backusii TaxID=314023 RepID=A0AA40DIF5_9PEZI|nr:amidase signature domain-containing protein [Apiosordaria backusii]
MPLCGRGFKLEEATIDDMQRAMRNGTVTAVQLIECYARRVMQTDDYINSLLEFNPDALDIAANLDRERRAGKVRGPMHGIPFTVKENIATKDRMETTAGSWALLGSRVPRDAFVVKKLKEAGAVLLGKATLSEWVDMRSNNYSEGYSARGGQARSPYNFTVNPGGSSSGSAIGVAANAVAVSIGTETDGSVINPAMRNSIVGFKPSVGLTSRAGVVPESEHQDSIGTFGRSVRDAIYTLDAIYGKDQRDNYTLAQQTPRGGYAQFLSDKRALRGATFGLPWQSFWQYADPEQLRQLTALLDLIKRAGATIINGTEITDYETIVSPDWWDWDWGTRRGYPNESEYTVVAVDFYNNIKTYLSELENTDIRSLEDIVQYNYENDGTEGGNPWPLGNPAFYSGQDGFLASLKTKGIQDETYWQALEFTQTRTRKGIDDALTYKGKKLDGLLVPPAVGQSYQISAQAGYPIITLPAGIHSATGMPFGLAILQTAWAEAELVKFGSAIEDLQKTTSGNIYKRSLPTWEGYKKKPIPLLNIHEGSD